MPEETLSCAQIMARVLKEEGVEHIFGVGGGSIFPMMVAASEVGIQIVHVRHEQAASFAADAYARAGRRLGVCFFFGGPGFANASNGIAQAYYSKSPVLALVGQHATLTDFRGASAASWASEECSRFTRWSVRVVDDRLGAYLTKKAISEATAYPPGPVVMDIPENVQIRRRRLQEQRSYLPGYLSSPMVGGAGDPDACAQAVEMLLKAERPAIVAGEQAYWEDAGAELRELAEALNVPVITRRLARGSVPEDHPLAFAGRVRGQVLRSTDVVLLVGLNLGYLEDFGRWGGNTRFIQVHSTSREVESIVPTEMAMLGNSKRVLRQMVTAARQLKEVPSRQEWLENIAGLKRQENERLTQAAQKVSARRPIHPAYLAEAIVDVLDDDATTIFDAYTGSAFVTERVRAKMPGTVLDTGEWITVGHGVGMGLGAQLARPGKQVFVMMGDGGMGIGGFDVETAVRYNLPVVFMVNNNSSWLSREVDYFIGDQFVFPGGQRGNPGMLTPIRYDQLYAAMGCHVERVEEPGDIRAALNRCIESGKTSVLDVVVDREVDHPMLQRGGPGHRWVGPDHMPEMGRKLAFPELYPKPEA
ncbi:MAG: thiamine pyrophosphate-binding protein [Dehalococcoidia bacterium]|jgi:acetolactate synthase-1/2/3 large subunit|nr:thiamine pyrophosphate-binding protein [Dehalococcoidia bacterium]